MPTMISRQAITPTTQLQVAPIEPVAPPPRQDEEGGVHRCHGLAAGDVPGEAAPDEKPAKRGDEGGDIHERGDRALEGADCRADRQAADQRDDPGPGTVEAQILRQPFGLDDTHDHRDEAKQRADRKGRCCA